MQMYDLTADLPTRKQDKTNYLFDMTIRFSKCQIHDGAASS